MISNFNINNKSQHSNFYLFIYSPKGGKGCTLLFLSSRSRGGGSHLAEGVILTVNIYSKAFLIWGWHEPLSEPDTKDKTSLWKNVHISQHFAHDRGGRDGAMSIP